MAETVNVSFRFLRRHIKPLGKALLLIAGPASVLGSAVGIIAQVGNITSAGDPSSGAAPLASLGVILSIVIGVASTMLVIGVLYGYVKYCMEGKAEDATVSALWQEARASLGRILVAMLASIFVFVACFMLIGMASVIGGVAVGIMSGAGAVGAVIAGFVVVGAVLAGLAGLFFCCAFSFLLMPILVFDKDDVVEAFGRSFELLRGRWLGTVGVLLLTFVLVGMLSFLVNVPVLGLAAGLGVVTSQGGAGSTVLGGLLVVAGVLSGLATPLIYVIPYLAVAFQYFGLVEEKDHVGLRERVEGLEAVTARSSEEAETSPPASDEGGGRWRPVEASPQDASDSEEPRDDRDRWRRSEPTSESDD
jgi:hypothetical protein